MRVSSRRVLGLLGLPVLFLGVAMPAHAEQVSADLRAEGTGRCESLVTFRDVTTGTGMFELAATWNTATPYTFTYGGGLGSWGPTVGGPYAAITATVTGTDGTSRSMSAQGYFYAYSYDSATGFGLNDGFGLWGGRGLMIGTSSTWFMFESYLNTTEDVYQHHGDVLPSSLPASLHWYHNTYLSFDVPAENLRCHIRIPTGSDWAAADDMDDDGVPDDTDNCPATANADQLDLDDDGAGDACDTCPDDFYNDSDSDGSCDSDDACPLDPADDVDGDGYCADEEAPGCDLDPDNDLDGDGVCEPTDLCPADAQNDVDGDGICGDVDPCPTGSVDGDGDGTADACDPCPDDFSNDSDGDGSCDSDDVCPLDPMDDEDGDALCADEEAPGCEADPDNDLDLDGLCTPNDACPFDAVNDADGDGVCEISDNCDTTANSNQSNLDGDTYGDACEPDSDGDGVIDDTDNCDLVSNTSQGDADHDGIGDACEADTDHDGIIDDVDACAGTVTGAVVNLSGCSVAQSAPCQGAWKNHGAYVSAVTRAAGQLVTLGRMTEAEKSTLVSQAARSTCGGR